MNITTSGKEIQLILDNRTMTMGIKADRPHAFLTKTYEASTFIDARNSARPFPSLANTCSIDA